jgi:colanic acid biosynthesis glycosyl transferase WcaI
MPEEKPSIAVLYHFFPPDETQSALHFGDLAEGLVRRGWQVSAYPAVWSSDDKGTHFPSRAWWNGVEIERVWRPNLAQASNVGRFVNAAWMILRWSLKSISRPQPDVLIVGTDPILGLSVAIIWRMLSPKTRVAHWCFDVYPEAAIADGLLPPVGILARFFNKIMGLAYQRCSFIADLGPCMRDLLRKYPTTAERETIVPWAFEEPGAPLPVAMSERRQIFGGASLALLYSGSFGRPHSYKEILDLAALLGPHNGKLVFSVRGKRLDELKRAVVERDAAVDFVPFAPPEKLSDRLACADIHVVTLHADWTGMVVPSKFFGAIAAGRPILFAGGEQSSLARWIREFNIGWVVSENNIQQICADLVDYIASPSEVAAMQRRCFHTYRQFFSRESQINKFDSALRRLALCDCRSESCIS